MIVRAVSSKIPELIEQTSLKNPDGIYVLKEGVCTLASVAEVESEDQIFWTEDVHFPKDINQPESKDIVPLTPEEEKSMSVGLKNPNAYTSLLMLRKEPVVNKYVIAKSNIEPATFLGFCAGEFKSSGTGIYFFKTVGGKVDASHKGNFARYLTRLPASSVIVEKHLPSSELPIGITHKDIATKNIYIKNVAHNGRIKPAVFSQAFISAGCPLGMSYGDSDNDDTILFKIENGNPVLTVRNDYIEDRFFKVADAKTSFKSSTAILIEKGVIESRYRPSPKCDVILNKMRGKRWSYISEYTAAENLENEKELYFQLGLFVYHFYRSSVPYVSVSTVEAIIKSVLKDKNFPPRISSYWFSHLFSVTCPSNPEEFASNFFAFFGDRIDASEKTPAIAHASPDLAVTKR